MSYNARTIDELVIAEIPTARSPMPFPYVSWAADMETYCSDLNQMGWGFLKNCLFDFTVYEPYTSNVIRKELKRKFQNSTDFERYVSDITPQTLGLFNGNCVVKIYNIVDTSIPSINRMFAFNKFYSCLLGTSKQQVSKVHVYSLWNAKNLSTDRALFSMNMADAAIEAFVKTAWQKVWGITPGVDGWPGYVDSPTRSAWLAAMWVQIKKDAAIYRLPASGEGLMISSHAQDATLEMSRAVADVSEKKVGQVQPYYPHRDEDFIIEKMIVCSIPIVAKIAAPLGDWTNPFGFEWHTPDETTFNPFLALDSRSCIAIYGVKSGDRLALYIKPYGGVDNYCFPNFDRSLYQLEQVKSMPMTRDRFGIVDLSFVPAIGHHIMPFRIPKHHILSGEGASSWAKFRRGNFKARTRFYLRRIGTEYVSPLSVVSAVCELNPFGKRVSAINYSFEYDRV